MRRDHVASTLIRHHFDVVCLLGRCFDIAATSKQRFSDVVCLLRKSQVTQKQIVKTHEKCADSKQPVHPSSLNMECMCIDTIDARYL